jgi:methylmalonyl-CoA/ethylmalonyl-CoA epimerase
MAEDYLALLEPLEEFFGAVVMHDQSSEEPEIGRRGGMVWLGDNSIEIGAPLGPNSPVRNFVEKFNGGMHSIALRVPDIDHARLRLSSLGLHPMADIAGQVFFTAPADSDGLMLEWSMMRTDDDPRFGYRLPQARRDLQPVAPARRYGCVTAVVVDPLATAERLAELFDTEVRRRSPRAQCGQISAIVDLVDCVLLLFKLPDEGAAWPWGPSPRRPRFHAHGLVVDDLEASLDELAAKGVRSVGRLEHAAFLDPTVVPVPTYLMEELFVEDSRH